MALSSGFVLCIGRRTISRVIQAYGLGYEKRRHHSIFYYFFSRAVWLPNERVNRILQLAIDRGLPPKDTEIRW